MQLHRIDNRSAEMGVANFSLSVILTVLNDLFGSIRNPAMNLLAKDYTVLWANQGMAIGAQSPLDEMIGRQCYHAFRRREEPCDPCLLKIVSTTKQPFVGEGVLDIPGKERQFAEIRAYPILNHTGVQFLLEIVTPLTGRKKDQERHQRYVDSLEKNLRKVVKAGSAAHNNQPSREQVSLTPRETEVLKLIAKGFSNREIASILAMSPDTVKTHVRNIFNKLEVSERAEAAVYASVNNLI